MKKVYVVEAWDLYDGELTKRVASTRAIAEKQKELLEIEYEGIADGVDIYVYELDVLADLEMEEGEE